MEKDIEITEVVFRKSVKNGTFKDSEGEVFAMFPYLFEHQHNPDIVMGYQRVGQHSVHDYPYCVDNSEPATEEEYASLKQELEDIGYNLKVLKRRNRNNVDKEFKKFKKRYV